jgi:hypothetical protein
MSAFIQQNAFADVKQFFTQLPDDAEDAAVFAINDVVGGEGMVAIRKETRSQIDFPAGYLEGERLRVGKRASKGMLEATIKARDRATSLGRFAAGQTPANTRGRGVRVQVKKGQTRVLSKGFMVDLKNGNRGVAVRLKPGESLRNSDKAVRLADNVFLLYGPSVEQVFKGVAHDVAPDLGRRLSRRFLHHFTRLTRRG